MKEVFYRCEQHPMEAVLMRFDEGEEEPEMCLFSCNVCEQPLTFYSERWKEKE